MSEKEIIIKLRAQTGAGIMDIKEALEEAGGDESKVIEILRKKGQKIAAKRAERATGEGWIGSYVHANGKLAALVSLRCETDFVARNPEFQTLAHDLAMQVVAANPLYLRPEDVPATETDEVCLLHQPFFKDDKKTVQTVLDEATAKIGEKIEVGEFVRVQI